MIVREIACKRRKPEHNIQTSWLSGCRISDAPSADINFAKRIKQCKKESGIWVFWHYWSVLSGSLHDPIRAASFSTVLSGFPFTFHSGKLPNVAKFD